MFSPYFFKRVYYIIQYTGVPKSNDPYKQQKAHFQTFGIRYISFTIFVSKIFKKLDQKREVKYGFFTITSKGEVFSALSLTQWKSQLIAFKLQAISYTPPTPFLRPFLAFLSFFHAFFEILFLTFFCMNFEIKHAKKTQWVQAIGPQVSYSSFL